MSLRYLDPLSLASQDYSERRAIMLTNGDLNGCRSGFPFSPFDKNLGNVSSVPAFCVFFYIQSWLKVLKNDRRAIFTAAAKAQEAVDWMNKRTSQEVQKVA